MNLISSDIAHSTGKMKCYCLISMISVYAIKFNPSN